MQNEIAGSIYSDPLAKKYIIRKNKGRGKEITCLALLFYGIFNILH